MNLNSDSLTPSQFLSVVADLTSRGAYFIHGYPGSIARLAAGLSDKTTSPEHSPRVVVAFAETLTPANAVIIRRVFRCPVANYYSSWEVPQIAHSCPEYPDSLHINLERVIVRVVRPDGTDVAAGEQGHVVLTDLENYVMPFINYFIGDRAVVGSACRCGRGFPTLSDVDGRASEIIRTPSGRYITAGLFGQLLTFVIGVIPYIWEYQVVQRSLNALTLRVVPTADYSREFEGALQRQVEDFLGPDVSVVIEPVARIPVEPSGKRFIIKSELLDNC